MNGRVYDPAIARFISADPIIQDPEHSQSYNRYTYVWNNPTNLTDPTGFMGVDPDPPPSPKSDPKPTNSVIPDCQDSRTSCGRGEESPSSNTKDPSGKSSKAAAQTLRDYADRFRAMSQTPDSELLWFQRGGPFDPRPEWAAQAGELYIQARALDGDKVAIGMMAGQIAAPFVMVGAASLLNSKGSGRLDQDIKVNPVAPAALPTSRPIGLSPTQNAEAQKIVAELKAAGYTDIRVNQQQLNASGTRVEKRARYLGNKSWRATGTL